MIRRSKFFIPFRQNVKEEPLSRMVKAGFISQHASGIFTWLNLGLRMIEKINKIVDEELSSIGAIKILMPTLQDAALWEKSDRLNSFGKEMLVVRDQHEREFIYGPTAEEVVTDLISKWPINKNSFPLILYNIQLKFRDEIRPRYAVLRSREFLMKDAYSFHKDEECLLKTYKDMFEAYARIFSRLGLKVFSNKADTGAMGGFMSHEFQIKATFGENNLQYEKEPSNPISWEERDHAYESESEQNYAEVGHIFALGDRYTQKLKALNPENGKPLLMGCYGIGISRLAGLAFDTAENGDLGVLAPFKYTILGLHLNDAIFKLAEDIAQMLPANEVIFDDRDVSAGVKFNEADLIGSPIQVHIGQRELDHGKVIIKKSGVKFDIKLEELENWLKEN
jgi:prolyl-tRNA synthetase